MVTKAKPRPKLDPRYRVLARHFPGHSNAYYHRVTHFFILLRKAQIRAHKEAQAAAFKAWIEAISFPPAYLVPVMNCIKGAESGNYFESSHPSSGSGAYQFVPGTWLTYFLRWRDSLPADHQYKNSYYALAFLAPSYVQDHVLVFALQNGGAHNWDPSYGNDSCTVGLP